MTRHHTAAVALVGLVVLAAGMAGAVQPNASASMAQQAKKCKGKVVKLGGKPSCIAAGQPCKAKYERIYEKYGFVCRGGTLFKKPAVIPAAQVVATIPVGAGPGALQYLDGSIWVQSFADGTVSRIDPATNTVVATIPAGGGGWGDVTYGDGSIWTVSEEKGAVSRIDPVTGTVVATTPSQGIRPMGLAWTPGAVWVGNHGHPIAEKAIVARIDTATNRVVWTAGVGIPEGSGTGGPFRMTAAFGSVWVQVSNNSELDRIDVADNSITRIPSDPCDGDSEAVGGSVWLSVGCSLVLNRVDPAKNAVVARVPYPAGGTGVGPLTTDGSFIWATMAPKLLVKFDPASGKFVGTWRQPAEGIFDGPAPLTYGDGSIWVSDTPRGRILRLKP